MSLLKDIAVGDRLLIGDITLRLQSKTGKKVRLSIDAPASTVVIVEKDLSLKT